MHAIHRLDPSAAFRPEFADARREYAARCAHWADVYRSEGGEVKLRWAESHQRTARALVDPSETTTIISSHDLVARLRHFVAPRRVLAVVEMLTRDFEQAKPAIPALFELLRSLDFDLQPLDRWEEGIARFGPVAIANFYARARAIGTSDMPEARAAWDELVRSVESPHRELVHVAIHRLGEMGAEAVVALSKLDTIAKGPSDGGPISTRARALLAIHRIEPSEALDTRLAEARRELADACLRWAEEYRATGNDACAKEWAETARLFSS
jgi:hypothetical protein